MACAGISLRPLVGLPELMSAGVSEGPERSLRGRWNDAVGVDPAFLVGLLQLSVSETVCAWLYKY